MKIFLIIQAYYIKIIMKKHLEKQGRTKLIQVNYGQVCIYSALINDSSALQLSIKNPVVLIYLSRYLDQETAK